MSHFSVLVITPAKPTKADLAAILQPWHEFECTGTDDQYVVNLDRTAEAKDEYNKSKERMIKLPDGTLVSAYDHQFYRDPTPEETKEHNFPGGSGTNGTISWTSQDWGDGLGYRTKVRHVPEGCVELEVPTSDTQTFAEFIEGYYGTKTLRAGAQPDLAKTHKYGWVRIDANGDVIELIDRTNPNKKWDWWQIGGRYTGRFALGYDPEQDPANREACWLCRGTGTRSDMSVENGCNGCQGTGIMTKWPTQWASVDDQVRKGDLDLYAYREFAANRALKEHAAKKAAAGDLEPPEPWEVLLKNNDVETARRLFWDNPAVAALKTAGFSIWDDEDVGVIRKSADEVAADARNGALSTFAVVKDGQWNELGDMGWFGMVRDEKDRSQWQRDFAAMLDGLSDDTWLTVVDCHI